MTKKDAEIKISKLKGIQKKVSKEVEANQKIGELTETIQRLQADFENYKKHVAKQNNNLRDFAKADIINKILPTLDSFEMALKNADNKEEFKKGVELIYSQLFQTLEDMGLKPIEVDGKFDPYKHEVLLTQESDKEDGTILEELQKGYALNETIIRHSKVKVVKNVKILVSKSKDTETKVSELKGDEKDGKGNSNNENKC